MCLTGPTFLFVVPTLMVRSDTDMLKPMYARSLSAPSEIQAAQDDSIIDIMKLQKYIKSI